MITINSIDDKYFEMDGVQFATIYQPLTQGLDNISIVSIYDTRQKLVNSTKYDEFTVDGSTFASQELLIVALLGVVWSKYTEADIEQFDFRISTNEDDIYDLKADVIVLDSRVDNAEADISILNDEVIVLGGRVGDLEENQVTGVEVYTNYSDLPASGTLLVSYKVSNDVDSAKNGYYHWNGSVYVKDAELYPEITASVEADGVAIVRLHNPELNFVSFVFVNSGLPVHSENNAFVVAETGTVLGVLATKGQIIVDDGVNFVAQNINKQISNVFIDNFDASFSGNTIYDYNIIGFVKEIYLNNAPDVTYFLELVRRNNVGNWWIKIKDGVQTVCEFPITTSSPEGSAGEYTVHDLVELNSSGITGQILVDWSALNESQYSYTMNVEFKVVDSYNSATSLLALLTRIDSDYLLDIANNRVVFVDGFETGQAALTKIQALNFVREVYLKDAPDVTYYLDVVRRNGSGAWWIRIKDGVQTVCEFPITTSSPEGSAGEYTVHDLVELNSSGITGQILVDWSALTDGVYIHTLSAEFSYALSLLNSPAISAYLSKDTISQNKIILDGLSFFVNDFSLSVGGGNAVSRESISLFVREIYLENTTSTCYIELVRRNNAGNWWVRIKDDVEIVSQIDSLTVSPENINGGLTLHRLIELNSSGVVGWILVDWSALNDGQYSYGMNAELKGFDSLDNSPTIKNAIDDIEFPDLNYGSCVNGLGGFFEKIRRGDANKQLQTKLIVWGDSIMGNNDRSAAPSRNITITPDDTIEPPCFLVKYTPYRLWSQMCLNDVASNDSDVTGVVDDADAIRDYIFQTGINYKKANYKRFDNSDWIHSSAIQTAMFGGDYTLFHPTEAPMGDRTNRITIALATSVIEVGLVKNLQIIYRSSDNSDQNVDWKIEELSGSGGSVVGTHSTGTLDARQVNIDNGSLTDNNGARRVTIAQKREIISETLDELKYYKLTLTKSNNTDEFCLWGVEYWGDFPVLDVVVPARPGADIEDLESNLTFDVIGHYPDGVLFEATRINDRSKLGGNPSITPGIEDTWVDKIGLINENYRRVFNAIKEQGIPLLVLIVHDVPSWGFSLNDGWCKATRDLCNEMGIPYIDVNRWMLAYTEKNNLAQSDWTYDNVHPDDVGYEIYNDVLKELLEYNNGRNTSNSFTSYLKKKGSGTAGIPVVFDVYYKETPKIKITSKGSGQYISAENNQGFSVAGSGSFDWEAYSSDSEI